MFGYVFGRIRRIKRIKDLGINKTWFFIAALFILTIIGTVFFVFQKENANQGAEKPAVKPSLNQIQVLAQDGKENKEVKPVSISASASIIEDFSLPQSITEGQDIVEDKALDKTEDIVLDKTGDIVMRWPGQGNIITEFGFCHSETFDDLRFHPGIDIALPPGYEVRAALPGTVVSISSTPMWGYEIVIRHGEQLETRYKGIKPLKEKGGYQVAKGDVIGQVVQSPEYEEKMSPHLHFEVYEFGKAVDPMKYL